MLFTSFHFLLLFLPAVLWIACQLRGQRLLCWITLASLAFYALEGLPWFLLPMLVTLTLDYFIAREIEQAVRPAWRRTLFMVSLCGNLGLLFYFKYAHLMADTWKGLTGHGTPGIFLNIVLPAGISFYTFQTISYVVDVYRREAHAETNFWKFAGFVSFFPHLVAGPLTRHHQLLPSLEHIAKVGVHPRWKEGIFLFAIGFCKKILFADRFGDLVDIVLVNPTNFSAASAWVAAIGYGLQIYFDFSGYSDMAIGLGRLFGVELPQNFNSPYQSKTPQEFWTRWHITLSRWMRDYLYIPLGGNLKGPLAQARNLLITMVLGGLWHGANWTFALWGLYHAGLLILYHLFKEAWAKLHWVIQQLLTFIAITAGWIFFRSTQISMAKEWWKGLLGASPYSGDVPTGVPELAIFSLVGLLIVWSFPNASHYTRYDKLSRNSQILLGLAFTVAVLYLNQSTRFLYYQF